MSPDSDLQRCDSCGEPYEPHLGRDGLCFTCATHLGCACADDPEAEQEAPDLHEHIASIGALGKPAAVILCLLGCTRSAPTQTADHGPSLASRSEPTQLDKARDPQEEPTVLLLDEESWAKHEGAGSRPGPLLPWRAQPLATNVKGLVLYPWLRTPGSGNAHVACRAVESLGEVLISCGHNALRVEGDRLLEVAGFGTPIRKVGRAWLFTDHMLGEEPGVPPEGLQQPPADAPLREPVWLSEAPAWVRHFAERRFGEPTGGASGGPYEAEPRVVKDGQYYWLNDTTGVYSTRRAAFTYAVTSITTFEGSDIELVPPLATEGCPSPITRVAKISGGSVSDALRELELVYTNRGWEFELAEFATVNYGKEQWVVQLGPYDGLYDQRYVTATFCVDPTLLRPASGP